MINLSLACLTLSTLTNSPFISSTFLSKDSKSSFFKLQLSHFSHSFYLSHIQSSGFKQAIFSGCNFNNFLSNVIKVDQINRMRFQSPNKRMIFSFDNVTVENCRFVKIKNCENTGGALTVFASLIIFNSYFHDCCGSEGGCISGHDHFNCSFTTFELCRAKQSAAFDIRTHAKSQILVSNVAAQALTADFFAFCYATTKGEFNVDYSNLTDMYANQCVGSLEENGGTYINKFTMFVRSKAKVHNGCLTIRSSQNFKIENCLFLECSHCSAENNAGASLLIYDNPYANLISDTLFVNCDADNSFNVAIASGASMKFTRCKFTGAREKEVNNQNMILDSTEFKQSIESNDVMNDFQQHFTGKTIGYTQIGKEENNVVGNTMPEKNMPLIHFVAVCISLVISFILQKMTTCIMYSVCSRKNMRENL
ncbi:hypothetical protein TRFO_14856 [Tritrichomonas foetus]|uniref:Right handed beta helix domain-containing protein n=1 Tax=Tritrichomonas foetus TaxID=1144522 RepID=A0A1J4KU68_9EUKA|nr:hypothetical protein TRFO_14856 [Tritrichomonas foetus]|eukprot:OHT14682.1 hypothetical protein TRFO_14856 [Tritrichomonas foetus]